MTSASFLNSVNYGNPSSESGAIGASITKPTSFLNSVNYGDMQNTPTQEQSADSILGNVGQDFDAYTKAASGIQGLFLPQLAQQMQTNASPIINGQVQTSMDYPPALLSKMMMGAGGAPELAEQQYMGNTLGGVSNAQQGLPNPMALLAGAGKAIQDVFKASPEDMLGLNGLQRQEQLNRSAQAGEPSFAKYNLSKALGVSNTPGNKLISGIAEAGAPLLLGGSPVGSLGEKVGTAGEKIAAALSSGKEPKISSQDFADTLRKTIIPQYNSKARELANSEGALSNSVMEDDTKKPDLTPFLTDKQNPTDEELSKYLPKIMTGANMKNPSVRNIATELWKQANPQSEVPHILPEDIRKNLSYNAGKIYKSFLQDPSGKNLDLLEKQTGSDAYGSMAKDPFSQNIINSSKDANDILNKVINNHLSTVPGALESRAKRNLIMHKNVYPTESTPALLKMSKGIMQGRTPDQLLSYAKTAQEKVKNGLPLNHYISQQFDTLKSLQDSEKNATTPKGKKLAIAVGRTLLGHLPGNKIIKNYKNIK